MEELKQGTKIDNNSYEVIRTLEYTKEYIAYLCQNKLQKKFVLRHFFGFKKQELIQKYKSEIESNKIIDIFEENKSSYVVYEYVDISNEATVKVSDPEHKQKKEEIKHHTNNKLFYILPLIFIIIGVFYFISNSEKNEIEELYKEAQYTNTINGYVIFKDTVLNNYQRDIAKEYLNKADNIIQELAVQEVEKVYDDLTYSLEDCTKFKKYIDNHKYLDSHKKEYYTKGYQEVYYESIFEFYNKNKYSNNISTLYEVQRKMNGFKQCLPSYLSQLSSYGSDINKKIGRLEYRNYKIKINYIEIENPSKWDRVSSSGKGKYPDLIVKIKVDNSTYYSDGTWKDVSSGYFDIVSKTFRAKSDTKVSIEIYDNDSGSQAVTAILTQILFDKSLDTGGIQTVGKWSGTVGDLIDDNNGKLSFDGISSLKFKIY
ncbi:MAG: hypothetical protein U9N59_15950 [Campylobacterota bacterium]|nr:hypothetical protein [Campylobacterota bacterium]